MTWKEDAHTPPDREMWHRRVQQWLLNEEEGSDRAAEEAFTELFQAVPTVTVQPDFVEHTVTAVLRAQATRRRRFRIFRTASSVALAGVGAFMTVVIIQLTSGWIVGEAAVVASRAALWLVGVLVDGMGAWISLARVATAGAAALITPQSVTAVLAVEGIAGLALFGLRRLLEAGPPWVSQEGRG